MSLELYLIDCDRQSRTDLSRDCEEAGWSVEAFNTVDDLLASSTNGDILLVIISIPPDWTGGQSEAEISRFRRWHEKNAQTQLILILSRDFSSGDRLALDLGARHLLYKPYRTEDLSRILARVAEGTGRRRRMSALKKRLRKPSGFEEIIGTSEKMRDVLVLAERIARSDTTSAMITGECGTGKGALARAIHEASDRCHGPFIEVNCAAIPRSLLESEFFGHEKGAFTDAKEEKMGLFECANGGTIFLDEVGEIDYSLQAKLLKFLDTRVIRRISGTRFLPVDVRVISATNRDLKRDVEEKRFRGDLYYRLNVVEVHIPPLRERVEDIRPIAESYLEKYSARLKKGGITLTERAFEALERYAWPGNVRELINIIERAVLLNTTGVIEPDDLPVDGHMDTAVVNIQKEQGAIRIDLPPEGASLEEIERGAIIAALARAGGNITHAARTLEIGRGMLRYKMKKFGIDSAEIKKNFENGQYEPVCTTD
jgi:two-component system response regulator AtoC